MIKKKEGTLDWGTLRGALKEIKMSSVDLQHFTTASRIVNKKKKS